MSGRPVTSAIFAAGIILAIVGIAFAIAVFILITRYSPMPEPKPEFFIFSFTGVAILVAGVVFLYIDARRKRLLERLLYEGVAYDAHITHMNAPAARMGGFIRFNSAAFVRVGPYTDTRAECTFRDEYGSERTVHSHRFMYNHFSKSFLTARVYVDRTDPAVYAVEIKLL